MQSSRLDFLDEEQLTLLCEQQNLTRTQIEAHLTEHPRIYRYYQIQYAIALYGSNAVYLVFPVITSNQGIKTLGAIFGLKVPDVAGFVIGAPLAVMDTLAYCLLFSPRKMAVHATLNYLKRQPLKLLIHDHLKALQTDFKKSLIADVKTLFHSGTVLTTNLTGTASEILYLPTSVPLFGRRLMAVPAFFYGDIYYQLYMESAYYEGLDFWFTADPNKPWMLGSALNGNLATTIEATMTGAGAVGLRVFPYFYFIVLQTVPVLRLPTSEDLPIFISVVVAWNSVNVLYPSVYQSYMGAKNAVKKRLSARAENRLLLALGEPAQGAMDSLVRKLTLEFKSTQSHLNLLREQPITLLKFLTQSALGGFFGYTLAKRLQPFMNYDLALCLMITSFALLFDSFLMQALYDKFIDAKFEQKLIEEDTGVAPPPPEPKNSVAWFALALNYFGNLSATISIIGTIEPLIGDNSPELTPLIILFALKWMVTLIDFNGDSISATAKELARALPSCGGLFSVRAGAPELRPAIPALRHDQPRFNQN